MLAGKAVVAIWNNITSEGRDDFYDWHMNEHIPERVAIPGFLRGRRYIATMRETDPEYFTLYETTSFDVLRGQDYAERLNAPTPWTRRATSQFGNTARALAHVLETNGTGMGGALLTVRFLADEHVRPSLEALMREVSTKPRISGAHLCCADETSSQVRTAESRDRTDIEAPPSWFALVEATDVHALATILEKNELIKAGARDPILRGLYSLEYSRSSLDCEK